MDLGDGLAYDFAEQQKILKSPHNFENDIIEASRNIAKRYHTNRSHTQVMEKISLAIFDKMKQVHGLGKRERLLLQIAVLLHDCGKYINMALSSECSYNIIMATEIIGLSHREREIVANVVRFNSGPVLEFEELASGSTLEQADYMTIVKLTAILRVANALDRSHKQKINEKAEFFESVFSIRPVLKAKRV